MKPNPHADLIVRQRAQKLRQQAGRMVERAHDRLAVDLARAESLKEIARQLEASVGLMPADAPDPVGVQAAIERQIRREPGWNAQELADACGCTYEHARRLAGRLRARGFINTGSGWYPPVQAADSIKKSPVPSPAAAPEAGVAGPSHQGVCCVRNNS